MTNSNMESSDNSYQHSQHAKQLRSLLIPKQVVWYQQQNPFCALVPVNQSPWQRLYVSRNKQALLIFLGIEYKTFHFLL